MRPEKHPCGSIGGAAPAIGPSPNIVALSVFLLFALVWFQVQLEPCYHSGGREDRSSCVWYRVHPHDLGREGHGVFALGELGSTRPVVVFARFQRAQLWRSGMYDMRNSTKDGACLSLFRTPPTSMALTQQSFFRHVRPHRAQSSTKICAVPLPHLTMTLLCDTPSFRVKCVCSVGTTTGQPGSSSSCVALVDSKDRGRQAWCGNRVPRRQLLRRRLQPGGGARVQQQCCLSMFRAQNAGAFCRQFQKSACIVRYIHVFPVTWLPLIANFAACRNHGGNSCRYATTLSVGPVPMAGRLL